MAPDNEYTKVKTEMDSKREEDAIKDDHSTPQKSENQYATTSQDKNDRNNNVVSGLETTEIGVNNEEIESKSFVKRDSAYHEMNSSLQLEDEGDMNITPTKNVYDSKFLQHSDSLVISEIDSQYSPGLNDSRCTFDLLSSIQSATQEIREKREKLKDIFVPGNQVLSSVYLEHGFLSNGLSGGKTSPTDPKGGDFDHNGEKKGPTSQCDGSSNVLPSHNGSSEHPNAFTDVNVPIMMVPGQHLLLPQQLKQLQQVQQVSMNYLRPNSESNSASSLSPHIYTGVAATSTSSTVATAGQIHNGNHTVMLHAQLPPGQSILQHAARRRTMKLKLMEEVRMNILPNEVSKKSIFSRVSVLARRTRSMGSSDDFELHDKAETMLNGSPPKLKSTVDRGEVTISWYDGTSTMELQDHVRRSVENKMRIGRKKLLLNLRVIDENTDPPEEIVLSPFIPDGSNFLVTFRVKDLTQKWHDHIQHHRAPPSPSAAPSPPGELEQELQRQISDVLNAENSHRRHASSPPRFRISGNHSTNLSKSDQSSSKEQGKDTDTYGDDELAPSSLRQNETNEILAQRLEKLNETLLLLHDEGTWAKDDPNVLKTEKKQVIFVIANYFVLFLSLIAISAEIHERAPKWMAWINTNITTVQNCASDKDALFQCVSEGNFSGLVASFVLWASQSVATKRFFLFGFDSPKKLWRVVYECCVTSFCWGFSYIFIRRGLNPDTRPNCVRKYWKDAVYGSLAGFNAAFMKAVLKNLLPQADEILHVMEHRQVRLVNFLGKIFKLIPGGQPSPHAS